MSASSYFGARSAARRPILALAAACLAACLPAAARAQSTLGTIRGTVMDPQRQVVAGAAVLVTDEDTGVPRVADTNSVGDYEVPSLRAGNYRIEINAPNLQPFRAEHVVLRAGETIRVDASLNLASAKEEVTVVATPSTIQLESQSISGSVTAQQLDALPRGSRDFQDFLLLSPNIVGADPNVGGIQFLGGRTYGASYVQDGQQSTGGIFGSIGNAAPSLDSIAEIQVLANSYSAEYGGLAGVVVTTRRGTARYDGTAFYDFNADELNARRFDQTLARLRRDDPVFDGSKRHRWGATLGGPIVENRTFFFAAYDGSESVESAFGNTANVPTEAMRNGDFSGTTLAIRDPNTGQPFANNRIPADRINQVSRNIADFFYPLPNRPALANGMGRHQGALTPETKRQRYDVRVDHELGSNNSVFARFSWQKREPQARGTLENANFPTLGFQNRNLSGRTLATSWTRIFTNNLLNEVRAGFNVDRSNRRSNFNAGQLADQWGLEIPAAGRSRLGHVNIGFPTGAANTVSIADLGQNALRDTETKTFSIGDTLTWLAGRHSLKFGGIYTRNYILDGFSLGVSNGSGQLQFDGRFSGNAFADFLLGMPFRSNQGINTRGTAALEAYANEFAGFAQDDWKINSDLTLFLGVRYEVLGNFYEKNDLLINFEPRTGSLVLPTAAIADYLSPGARATVPLLLADDVDVSRALVNNDTNNISPRVGFAYRIGDDGRTVLRGGTGLFYPTQAAQGIRDALSRSPFRYSITRNNPEYTRAFSTGAVATNPSFGVNAVDMNLESAEVWQYNLTLERELMANLGARVTYMGSRLRKLLVNRDVNTVPPSTVPFDDQNPADLLRLPYPNLGAFLNTVENAGEGTFHAMQIEVRRPYRGGLQFEGAYTLSYTDSNAPDLGNSSLGVVQYDPYNLEADRGPDPSIPRHRLVVNAAWELPVGRGRRFGASMAPWADAVIGGWTITGIFQARSGHFLTPFFTYGTDPIFPANTGKAYDTVNGFTEAWKPDVVGDPNAGPKTRTSWFNLDAFRIPAPGTVGNAKRGAIVGPGTWVANLGLYKDVIRTNALRAEFRATFDNVFNHPQLVFAQNSAQLDITPFLRNDIREDGVMNAPAAFTGNVESFALGRMITLGVRVKF